MWVKIAVGLAVLVGSWIAHVCAQTRIHGSLLPSTFWAASRRHSFC